MCGADLGRVGFTPFLCVPVVQVFHFSSLVRKHPRPARHGVFAVSVGATAFRHAWIERGLLSVVLPLWVEVGVLRPVVWGS